MELVAVSIIIMLAAIVIVGGYLYSQREPFKPRDIREQIKDYVESKMTPIQFKAKYGQAISTYKLMRLSDAYRAGNLNIEKIRYIMA